MISTSDRPSDVLDRNSKVKLFGDDLCMPN